MTSYPTSAFLIGVAALAGLLIPLPGRKATADAEKRPAEVVTDAAVGSPGQAERDLMRDLAAAEGVFDYAAMRPLQVRAAHGVHGFRIAALQPHLRNGIFDLAAAARESSAGTMARRLLRMSAGYGDAVMAALLRCRSLGATAEETGDAAARRFAARQREVPLDPPSILDPADEAETCRLGKVAGPEFDTAILTLPESAWLAYARGSEAWRGLSQVPAGDLARAAENLSDGTRDFAAALPLVTAQPPPVARIPLIRWVYRDPLGALARVQSLDNAALRDVLIEAVGFQIGSCRQEVAARALEISGDPEFLKGMVRGMCLRNPEESLPVYRRLPEEDLTLLSFALKQMAFVDPLKAAQLQGELLPESPPTPTGSYPASLSPPEVELPRHLIARNAPEEAIISWIESLTGQTAETAADLTARKAALAGRTELLISAIRILESRDPQSSEITIQIVLGSSPEMVKPLAAAGFGTEEELQKIVQKSNYRGLE